MKSVMLTGATGFIGSHIAESLLREKIPTHLFVRKRNSLIDSFENIGATIFQAQPLHTQILKESLEGVDCVIHCAGATKAPSKKDLIEANVEFTRKILCLLKQRQKLVFISSQAAAGPSDSFIPIDEKTKPNPLTYYGKSKLLAEQYIKEWGREKNNNYVILRPSVVYGPRERDLYHAFKFAKKGFFFSLGSGDIKLSLIHVKDLIKAIMKVVEYPFNGETYFVTDDGAYSWEEIGCCIKKAFNKSYIKKIKVPISLAYPVICVFDFISSITGKQRTINRQKFIEINQSAWLCSNRKIKEELGWKPEYSLEKGIKQTLAWYTAENWV